MISCHFLAKVKDLGKLFLAHSLNRAIQILSTNALNHHKDYKGIFILITNFWWPTFLLALVQPTCLHSYLSGNLKTRPAGFKAALTLHCLRAGSGSITLQRPDWEGPWLTQIDHSRAPCLPQAALSPCHMEEQPHSLLHGCMPAKAQCFFLKASATRAAQFIVTERLSGTEFTLALACLILELFHSKWLVRRFNIVQQP